jgi:xanthine dehydrogenase large subunit
VSEVRVDRRTGGVEVVRADLLIDIGRSINPGIDRGQVIGGFMQGLGWTTTECLVYDRHGCLLTDSSETYKIPTMRDLPTSLSCSFFASDGPAETIGRSKGVGEPPLLLALSAWCAVADALTAVGGSAAARLCLPATDEEVLRALSLAHEPLIPDAWQHSAMHLLCGNPDA